MISGSKPRTTSRAAKPSAAVRLEALARESEFEHLADHAVVVNDGTRA